MAIEFLCANCGKTLRTGDDTAGKPARCPACSSVTTVPGAPAAPPPPPMPLAQPQYVSSDVPPAGDPNNPYQSPAEFSYDAQPSGLSRAYALVRISGPSIMLIVTGALGMLLYAGLGVMYILLPRLMPVGPPNQAPPDFDPHMMFGIMGAVVLFLTIPNALIIFGAMQMRKLRSYGWAMAAAIMAMIPCVTGYCLLIGLPAGIWSLVAMHNQNVRPHFRS